MEIGEKMFNSMRTRADEVVVAQFTTKEEEAHGSYKRKNLAYQDHIRKEQ